MRCFFLFQVSFRNNSGMGGNALTDSTEDARYDYYMQDMSGISPVELTTHSGNEGAANAFGTNTPMEGGWKVDAVS